MVVGPGTCPGQQVTCPVQTYLDLRASTARGEEAAQAVFDRHLAQAYG